MILSYAKELVREKNILSIKRVELEQVNFEESIIAEQVPPAWFPNGLEIPENYRGPRIKFTDHHNS